MNKKMRWLLWGALTCWMIAEAVEAAAKFAVINRLEKLEQRMEACQCLVTKPAG